MESLLTTFLSVLLAECGDRTQILAAALALRFRNDRPVLLALVLASAITIGMSAAAGSVIDQYISEDPVRLFNGLAFASAGLAMLAWRKKVDLLSGWRTGPFWTAFLGLFILQFGDKSQFLIVANAATTPAWGLTALGGWLGMMAAVVPAILLKERLAALVPLNKVRRIGGAAMLLYGIYLALRAWHII